MASRILLLLFPLVLAGCTALPNSPKPDDPEFAPILPEDEPLMPHQQEIALAALAQIETAVNTRRAERMARSA